MSKYFEKKSMFTLFALKSFQTYQSGMSRYSTSNIQKNSKVASMYFLILHNFNVILTNIFQEMQCIRLLIFLKDAEEFLSISR